MKKLNLLRLLFGAMFLIAATAFTSCVDDNDDDGMPYLEVAPEALTFSAEGPGICRNVRIPGLLSPIVSALDADVR